MNTIFFLLAFWAWMLPTSSNPTVTAEEAAARMCKCGQENKLPALAQSYKTSTSEAEKESRKSALVIAVRESQRCANSVEIAQAQRNLPKEQRTDFEKKIMEYMNRDCNEVAAALYLLR